MSKRLFSKTRPSLFKPKFRKEEKNLAASFVNDNYFFKTDRNELLLNTNFESTSSFRYQNKTGLVSTQEVNIDYAQFENHTFFHSAVAKTNEAFDNIVNHYPYDGTLKEIEVFEDSLTGFEKHVLDSFPKNVGYLNFSGSTVLTGGTQISVKDTEGTGTPSLAKNKTAKIKLDPIYKPFSLQMYLNLPAIVNDNQIITQKYRAIAENFTLFVSESASTSECKLCFGITSGSNHNFVSGTIKKGSFSHITAMYDKGVDNKLKLIIYDNNENKTVVSSSNGLNFGNLNYHGSNLTIGSGVECRISGSIFTPKETLSGSIDDLKLYHTAFNEKEVLQTKNNTDNKNKALKLYYKFNEPYGDYTGKETVLDSSGNSLNTTISNYHTLARLTGSFIPVLNEDTQRSPVLFPAYDNVLSLNTKLLNSASIYDEVNPNLITRFVPRHYFDEGNIQDNYTSALGDISKDFSKLATVRSNTESSSSAQLLTKFLLTWAKFFDEIKIFIDNFSLLSHVSYREKNTIASKFLYDLGGKYGIDLPTLFGHGNNEQIFYGSNVTDPTTKIVKSLIEIQHIVWRNILTNIPQIMKKKGTVSAIKSIFRASGIEADNLFRVREYGGSKIRSLEGSVETKKDIVTFLDFSGSVLHQNESVNIQGISATSPIIKSNYLSSSRKEIGYPIIKGSYVNKNNVNLHGESNNASDGLLTSGSFTYQGTYKFASKSPHNNEQSLVRLHTTGSASPSLYESAYINLVANKEQERISLFMSYRPTDSSVTNLILTGVNIFDGDPWAISFGRANPERVGSKIDNSFYFIRAGKFNAGKKLKMRSTGSYIESHADHASNNITANYNISGSFLAIGSQSLNPGTPAGYFLNNGTTTQKQTYFSGEVTSINFWSKFNTISEFERYGKDILSVGSKNPLKSYNHNYLETGSFGRLRLQTIAKQGTTGSDSSGGFRLFDVTQNNFHLNGTGFEADKLLMKSHYTIREMLDYDFDLNTTNEKIRIRSFKNINKAKNFKYATTTPVYEVRKSEEVFDDTRFSIDLSAMKGLNENIMRTFSNFSFFDNALGKPNTLFSSYYKDIIGMRRMYFNDVLEKLDIEKYRNLFKWIDNTFTELVFSLIPRTTNFLGINFIYESHVLERHRLKYLYNTMYTKSLPTNPQAQLNTSETFEASVDNGNISSSTGEDIPSRSSNTPTNETWESEPDSDNTVFSDDNNTGEVHNLPSSENDPCSVLKSELIELINKYNSGILTLAEYDKQYAEKSAIFEEVCKGKILPAQQRIGDNKQSVSYAENKDESASATGEGNNDAQPTSLSSTGKVDHDEENKQDPDHDGDKEKHYDPPPEDNKPTEEDKPGEPLEALAEEQQEQDRQSAMEEQGHDTGTRQAPGSKDEEEKRQDEYGGYNDDETSRKRYEEYIRREEYYDNQKENDDSDDRDAGDESGSPQWDDTPATAGSEGSSGVNGGSPADDSGGYSLG